MPFIPCLGVADTSASIAFYQRLGFEVDSSTARPGDDLHMLSYRGQFCGMLYSNADLKNWLPVLAGQSIGFTGMFYLGVDDFERTFEEFSEHAEIVKPVVSDHNGQREFYFRDPDGYVIGINDNAALRSSDLGKKYA
ncbi:VOC family protein [Nocardia sp. CDC160]|uniref:VOC family protein n=1 Tax=Nocardia sp. CDC160 TaxID=3112166 RepID=UPI002DBBC50E|nr:VOC family protein [Nocardia sp. CDC160]MEC3915617.1 VOC family protein [Nocardia sp. CDC160]